MGLRVVVCVKQVVQLPGYVEFTDGNTAIDPAFATYQLNEPDTYALEEALQLREAAGDGEVVVVTVGDEDTTETLRKGLAMGADRAVRVWSNTVALHDPVTVARALAVAVRAEAPDFLFCGVQSSDAAQQSTGPAIASVLGLPCVTVATKIEHTDDTTIIHRELGGGRTEIIEVAGPVVVTIQTGLNSPRFGTFKEMVRAKKATIPVVDPGDLGLPAATVRRLYLPEEGRRHVEMLDRPADVAARILQLVREER